MNLSMLKPGETGKIQGIRVTGPLKRRLMDMGVLVGEVIKVIKKAPFGDPIEVTIKNYNLSLRQKEAEVIIITTEDHQSSLNTSFEGVAAKGIKK
jgi:ferrous iron transport protein A